MTRVAIQGEAGAFSHEAAHRLLGPDIELVACRTFSEAFHAVSSGEAERAVIPVENALAGPVVESLDLLWTSGLTVRGETRVRIRLCVSAPPGVALEDVRSVASHPVALRQCQNLFEQNPQIEPVVVYDTAGSVSDMMAGSVEYDAAISSQPSSTELSCFSLMSRTTIVTTRAFSNWPLRVWFPMLRGYAVP